MRMIPTEESLEIEFKSDRKKYPDNKLVEDIVGMTNTTGGTIYLGVEDSGEITGVHEDHSDPTGLVALIANKTVPPVAVRAELIQQEGNETLRIEVPRSRTVVSTSAGKILKRRLKYDGEPELVPMFSYEIPSRLSDLGLLDYSARPLPGATLDDLDPNQRVRLRKIIQRRQGGEKNLLTLSDEELDRALHLVMDMADREVPTVTGILLLGKEERIAELMPTARSSFQVLEGTTVRINEESSKPLLELFEDYETYLKAWNPERESEYGLFRLPIPEFDWSAFREGLVNAFCHRDYTILGNVRVLIDDEGLTISNPGGFIEGVNLKNLLTVEPHGRNPALADALKRIGLSEKTGRGIDRIFEGAIVYGRPWPDYSESTCTTVKLFMQRAKADMPFVKYIADEQNKRGKALSIYTLMIVSLIHSERRVDIDRIMDATNLSESKVRSAIENMVELGMIEARGRGSNRAYIMSEKLYKETDTTVQYVRQTDIDRIRYEELVLKLARKKKEGITKHDVCELLNITPSQAYAILRRLSNEKKIKLLYGGKYAKYVLKEESAL